MPGIAEVPCLTNESMMALDFVPPHLLVIGGSYVGLEFAQMMRRFGSQVTVIEMGPRLVGREDEDVSQALKEILEAEEIEVRLNATCLALEPDGNGVAVALSTARTARRGSPAATCCSRSGARPIPTIWGSKRPASGPMRAATSWSTRACAPANPGVWALGDCNGKGAFTHTTYNDYEIVAANLLEGAERKWTDRVPVYALYTDPPLGRVGMSEAEIRKAGIAALVGKRPMARVSRAVEKGETQGLLKIHVEAIEQAHPRRRAARHRLRRGGAIADRRGLRAHPLPRIPAPGAHPPHRERTAADHAGEPGTALKPGTDPDFPRSFLICRTEIGVCPRFLYLGLAIRSRMSGGMKLTNSVLSASTSST